MELHRITLPPTLGPTAFAGLVSALDRAAADPDARVVAFVGADEGFCRGMDLGLMVEERSAASGSLRAFAALLSHVRRSGRPTMAIVDGEAVGGGVGIAAACDLVLATTRATFALPEALFGILPGVVMPVLLERMTPQALRLFVLSGASRPASWAATHGLVDELTEPEALPALTRRVVRELSRVPARHVLGLRRWLSELGGLDTEAGLERGASVTAALIDETATRDAVRTFLDEGVPPWMPR